MCNFKLRWGCIDLHFNSQAWRYTSSTSTTLPGTGAAFKDILGRKFEYWSTWLDMTACCHNKCYIGVWVVSSPNATTNKSLKTREDWNINLSWVKESSRVLNPCHISFNCCHWPADLREASPASLPHADHHHNEALWHGLAIKKPAY